MWNRRYFLSSCTAYITFASAVRAEGVADPDARHATKTRQDCIDICIKTHRICLDTVRYVTERGGVHLEPHLALLLDCAEMCQATANSMLRNSPEHAILCGACAALCEVCAKDCEGIPGDDQMTRCASVCRDCAQDCRAMVVAAGFPHRP